MAKMKVFIEETLCKEIEFDLPDNMSVDERMELAEKMVVRAYNDEEIILTADDFNGNASIMVQDVASGSETSWNDL